MSEKKPRMKLTDKEKIMCKVIKDALHEALGHCIHLSKGMEMDHGTALTICHREVSLLSLGLLGTLMTGQETEKNSNDMLFMAQTRYQLDMGVMLTSFEKFTGRKVEREHMPGAAYHA